MTEERRKNTVRFLTRAGIFSALASILYILSAFVKIPLFADMLNLHFDEIPVFIASFAYGPFMGIVCLVVKTLLKLPFTHTLCIGELADLLFSVAFIIPAAIIYNKKRKFSSVLIGFGVGFILELVISFFFNIFVMIPFYGVFFELPQEFLDEKWLFGVSAILPFNAVKNVIVIAITLPTYKSIHKLIDKINK